MLFCCKMFIILHLPVCNMLAVVNGNIKMYDRDYVLENRKQEGLSQV